MHTIKLQVQDTIYDHIMFLLKNLNTRELQIIEDKATQDDWSYLEADLDTGLNSGMSDRSHEEIMLSIKEKYV